MLASTVLSSSLHKEPRTDPDKRHSWDPRNRGPKNAAPPEQDFFEATQNIQVR